MFSYPLPVALKKLGWEAQIESDRMGGTDVHGCTGVQHVGPVDGMELNRRIV